MAIRVLAILLLGASSTGCMSRGPPVVPVSGILKCNGHPIANLQLSFIPTTGPASTGMSDSTGRFKLIVTPKQDGAVVGTHTVIVSYNPPPDEFHPAPSNLDEILAKFGSPESSPLKVEISQAKDNLEINLD